MDALQNHAFTGRGDYVAALKDLLLRACAAGCRDIHCLDTANAGFVEWPWSDPAVLDALTRWAGAGRRLHLLAAQYDDLRRRHPRFVQWRVTWGHCVEARAYEEGAAEQAGKPALESALIASGGESMFSLRLFDAEHWRGAVSIESADALRTREWFDALAQRSCESFAATTLGL